MKSVRPRKRKMTLRAAFDEFYAKDELQLSSLKTIDAAIKAWERLSGNPEVADVDNETIARFRAACIEYKYAPATINGYWTLLRAIFRRIAPQESGNPWGAGVIARVPAMRPVRDVHRRPYRVPLEDLNATYEACDHAVSPRKASAPNWWRALLCIAYTTGLRRGDLFSLKWSQINLEARTLDFTARKTGKADIWPLHPVAIRHLRLLNCGDTNGLVFPHLGCGAAFYRRFYHLQGLAGVKRHFGLHDIRRTAASEIERVKSGLAPEFLQHAPRTVTEKYYLNQFEELEESLGKLRLARGFKDGPTKADRELRKLRLASNRESTRNPKWSTKPPVSDWSFFPGGFVFRGVTRRLEYASRWRLLKLLATTDHPVEWQQCAAVVGNPLGGTSYTRIKVHVCELRKQLSEMLPLPASWNPIPSVGRGYGAWTLSIP